MKAEIYPSEDIAKDKKILRELLKSKTISLRTLAERTGYSRSTWSLYLDGNYNGDVEKVDRKLVEFINDWLKREQLAETSATKILKSACAEAFEWKRLGIIVGGSGVGKTATIKALEQEQEQIIVIDCHRAMRPREVFTVILEKLNEPPTRYSSNGAKVSGIINALQRKERIIIFDEADQLTSFTIDVARRIWDEGNCGMLFIGLPVLSTIISRGKDSIKVNLSYFDSRISLRRQIPGPNLDDIKKIISLYNSDLSPQMLKHIRGWISNRGELRILINVLEKAVAVSAKSKGIITDEIFEMCYKLIQGFN